MTAVNGLSIQAKGVGKSFRLGTNQRGYNTLRESLVNIALRPVRRTSNTAIDTLWALRDVSMTIHEGEVVGLIGHNGAGKSTFLKILSRITDPTTGWVDVTGRVGSLLEVGTGFHPELTGRENIYLNGAILGMRRSEIQKQFDAIVDFAEIERFLDTPVKRYSSGMSVRLAFAVAAHLEPEILLVDEVLAVGDAAFQRKSLGKMGEVAAQGRTVVFISHNLAVIQSLCQRAVVLDKGSITADGPVMEATSEYLRGLERAASADLLERVDRDNRGWQEVRVRRLEITDEGGHPDLVVSGRSVTIRVHLTDVMPMLECRLMILNALGQPITVLDSEILAPSDVRDPGIGPQIECRVAALPLVPGRYRIDVLLKGRRQIQDGLQAAAFFDVEPSVIGDRPVPTAGSDGDVLLAHTWTLPA
ncbi:MAG TPA: ABC transporter ATP-binding protein [Gaiellaceae bacterium]|nr:ABC transporter ATP-binding protein [Gaiellaceae bacterium]